jgi:hypothetical protein
MRIPINQRRSSLSEGQGLIARIPRWPISETRQSLGAALLLTSLLIAVFAPAILGSKTLLLASWDAASILNSGAYEAEPRPEGMRLSRTSDPGAPAWQTEPWFALIGNQFWTEFNLPLWNPYSAYGAPLAATGQPQPFFPLTILLSLKVTAWTYNLFIVGRLLLGGLLMFLFARQFLTALPSLFAAITLMLSGYFIIYLNMPHLSVEVLTPGFFLVFELLLRRNSWSAAAGVATMILVGNLGGMPESMFLIGSFAGLYFICRLLFAREFRARALALLVKFTTAVVLGFALSAFVLLPFAELTSVAFDAHQPSNVGGTKAGLSHDADFFTTITYLLPLIFGPVLGSIFADFAGWSGLRGYWGIIPFYFGLAAVMCAFSTKRASGSDSERFLILFFATTLVLMMLKRYGSALINWIGVLPLSEMVVYPKYQEPLIALCVAMLAGTGFAVLAERRASPRLFVLAGVAVLALIAVTAGSYLPEVLRLPSRLARGFYFISLTMGGGLLLVTVAAVWLMGRLPLDKRPWLLRGIAGLLAAELFFNFIVPCFYLFGSLPPAKADPYAGAPYISFLRGLNADHSRIFARENFLYPNWSSVFALPDVRNLDALLYGRYRLFIRSFLLAPGDIRIHGDLADRFTGGEFPFDFATETEKRFLALSSVKYLISDTDYVAPSKLISEFLEQHRGETILGFGADMFRIGDKKVRSFPGLSQRPPSNRLAYKTIINSQEPVVQAIATIKIEAANASDRVYFRLEIKDGDTIETLFETSLDPRNNPSDRAGRPFRIDLSRYAGREVELLFSTDVGPNGNGAADRAGWVDLRFATRDGAQPPSRFRKLYDGEVSVYAVSNVLPRAALFSAIEVMPDDAVLRRLKDPAFNLYEKAVVSRESATTAEASQVASLVNAAAVPPSAAQVSSYESQYVRIEAETPTPALLVLNDANYPGWRAYVNGHPAEIVTANYLFRGVFLAAGKNTVEFKYQPRSFQLGAGISLAAFAMLGGLVFRERRRIRWMRVAGPGACAARNDNLKVGGQP